MAARTFIVPVEGIGAFTFRRRTLRDEIAIGATQERLTEGLEDLSEGFRRLTYMVAVIEVLTVEAPDDWSLMDLDPLDPTTFERIGLVFGGLRDAEERFRAKPGEPAQGAGAYPGQVA